MSQGYVLTMNKDGTPVPSASKEYLITNPVQTLDNAMTSIVSEIFRNGPEESNRIWVNVNHPLHQAIRILLRAQLQLQSKEGFYDED